jgi:hypothetical protein
MQHKESAMSRWPAFMLFIAVAVSSELTAQIQDESVNYKKFIAQLARFEFDSSDRRLLGVVSGNWVMSGGTFNSTATTTAIATIDSMEDLAEIRSGSSGIAPACSTSAAAAVLV